MYPYLLKRKLFWRFVQFTQSRDDITRLLLVLLVCMENIFKELFLSALSRGVPLDCGCKGRHFLQTDQTLLQLFYRKFLTKSLSGWFSSIATFEAFLQSLRNWQICVAKHDFSYFKGFGETSRTSYKNKERWGYGRDTDNEGRIIRNTKGTDI